MNFKFMIKLEQGNKDIEKRKIKLYANYRFSETALNLKKIKTN